MLVIVEYYNKYPYLSHGGNEGSLWECKFDPLLPHAIDISQ